LYKGIAQQPGGDPLHIFASEISGQEILDRGINALPFAHQPSGNILDGLTGGAPHIVRYTGTETDFNQIIKVPSGWSVYGILLDDAVTERFRGDRHKFDLVQFGINGIDVNSSNAFYGYVQKMINLSPDPVTSCVRRLLTQANLNSMGHYSSLSSSILRVGYGIRIPFFSKHANIRELSLSVAVNNLV